jgi:hypothetical protein
MRKSIKFAGIVASLALGLMPVMAAAQVHAHPSRQTLANTAQLYTADNAAFEANYVQFHPEQPTPYACDSNCQPIQMYGIGY